MKFHIIAITIIVCGCFTAQGVDMPKADETPMHHLTTYKGFTADTTHPDITIWTKENPFTTPDDQLINAQMIVSPLSKNQDWEAILRLHSPGKIEQELIGTIPMIPIVHTYEDSKKSAKFFCFSLTAKYFRRAVIEAWCEEGDAFDLYMHKQPIKAEQDGTGQPATRSESKPEGGDKPQPESEGHSR